MSLSQNKVATTTTSTTITINSKNIALVVKPEVAIIGKNDYWQEQFVIVGQEILLTCHYNALPLVSEVKWEKNGSLLAQNASTVISDPRVAVPHYNESLVQLSINATTSEDAGNYTCLATNDIGSSSDTTIIVIQGMYVWVANL